MIYHSSLWIWPDFQSDITLSHASVSDVTQEGRGHTRPFAFNEDCTEHKPVVALKSLIAEADVSDDKKTTSVNICFGNWNWPWNGTLTLFSVFVDQLGRTDLHSRINLKTITAALLVLSFDSSVASLALGNSKPLTSTSSSLHLVYVSLEMLFLLI